MPNTVRYSDLDLDFALTPDGDLKAETDREAVKQSMRAIMNTLPGERVYRPEFGCDLQQFLFQPIDRFTADAIGNKILSTFERFEPRVEIDEVSVNANHEQQIYEINVHYTLRSTGEVDRLNLFLEKM